MENEPSAGISWVVFDLGGVLSSAGPNLVDLAALLDTEPDRLEVAYWGHRKGYDRGDSSDIYWRRVAADLDASVTPALVSQLTRIDLDRWTTLDAEADRLLDDLAQGPARLGLLSNAPAALADVVRNGGWGHRLDKTIFSADHGLMKPDREAFDAATVALAVRPDQILFFDDRPDNVKGAIGAGWQAHLWRGHASARTVLAGMLR